MTVRIPFLDIHEQNIRLHDELRSAFTEFIESGAYILAERVADFESSFSSLCGTKYCTGVSNGLDALTILLKALGVKSGDEVIVPSNTYIATWLAITNIGAHIIPVEPDYRDYLVSPSAVEKLITNRTKAIIIVHLYGFCCDIPGFYELSLKYDIPVIEDAAQAHGASYKGRSPGEVLHGAAYSFYPSKNLGALGDGGAIVTNHEPIDSFARLFRNYGSGIKYYNEIVGGNCRLDELQAAFLNVKLKYLAEYNSNRRHLANRYLERLAGLPIRLPLSSSVSYDVWHLFVIRIEPTIRDSFCAFLRAKGIDTMFHYPLPPHKQLAYSKDPISLLKLPVSEQLHKSVVSLPIGPTFTISQIDFVCEHILEYFNHKEHKKERKETDSFRSP